MKSHAAVAGLHEFSPTVGVDVSHVTSRHHTGNGNLELLSL